MQQTINGLHQVKVIIAGSRCLGYFKDLVATVDEAVKDSGFEVTEVVSGTARGVDEAGELWGERNDVPVERFEPAWHDLNHPEAVVKTGSNGEKYNANAGPLRNREMAQYSDALVLIWDGESDGSRSMKEEAEAAGLEIHDAVLSREGQKTLR